MENGRFNLEMEGTELLEFNPLVVKQWKIKDKKDEAGLDGHINPWSNSMDSMKLCLSLQKRI